jgi:hypothetical protein
VARPKQSLDPDDQPSWDAFETELWRAVKRGSVTAMKLWADLHRGELEERGEDDPVLAFVPRRAK